MKTLPDSIQQYITHLSNTPSFNSIYTLDKLTFVNDIYINYNTYEEIWKNVSRMQAFRVSRTERKLIDKTLLGEEKYNAIIDLIEEAKASL